RSMSRASAEFPSLHTQARAPLDALTDRRAPAHQRSAIEAEQGHRVEFVRERHADLQRPAVGADLDDVDDGTLELDAITDGEALPRPRPRQPIDARGRPASLAAQHQRMRVETFDLDARHAGEQQVAVR